MRTRTLLIATAAVLVALPVIAQQAPQPAGAPAQTNTVTPSPAQPAATRR